MSRISVGICAYNEQQNIGRLLRNLLTQQKLQKDSEIIVVCSGCTDSTAQIVTDFTKKDSRVKLIEEGERLGKSSAINKILENYTGEFIFLIPSDVIPAKAAIALMTRKMEEDSRIGVMGGSPIPTNNADGYSGYLSHLMWRIHNKTLGYLDDLKLNNHASGEFMVLRHGIVNKLPLDVVNDDAYIAVSASSKGCIVKYCDEAKVYIKAPENIADYIRQRRRVVYGHFRVKQITKKYPQTVENMLFSKPQKSLHVLEQEMSERPKESLKLFVAIFIEALVNILAISDLILRKKHTVWAVSKSTKTVNEIWK